MKASSHETEEKNLSKSWNSAFFAVPSLHSQQFMLHIQRYSMYSSSAK